MLKICLEKDGVSSMNEYLRNKYFTENIILHFRVDTINTNKLKDKILV